MCCLIICCGSRVNIYYNDASDEEENDQEQEPSEKTQSTFSSPVSLHMP